MLTLPQLTAIRQEDPFLAEALSSVQDALNNLSDKLGLDSSPAPQSAAVQQNFPAPRPPSSLFVIAQPAGTGKIYCAVIGPSPDADNSIQYSIEYSPEEVFETSTPLLLGIQGFATLLLGNGMAYWRARARFPESAWSPYTYFGTQANPAGV